MHTIASLFTYLIHNCYEEDYDPCYAEFWYENYCYSYTFSEWYFFYRRSTRLRKTQHTPAQLFIGIDRLSWHGVRTPCLS